MMDWTALASILALGVSVLALMMRSFDKNLSIREYEAYREAVGRDILRIESRLLDIERRHPTTGELEIVAEALNKRIDEIKDRQARS